MVLAGTVGSSTMAVSPAASPATSPSQGSPSHSTDTGLPARPWLDSGLPIHARIAVLLQQMTLEEKIGQMTQIESDSVKSAGVARYLLGSVLASGSGNPPGPNDAQDWYAMVDGYQQAALGTRLGIPIMYGVDMVHGASHMTGTTIFPHNIGLGATRDPALVQRVCRATAEESSAAGVRWTFGPSSRCPRMSAGAGPMRATGSAPVLVRRLGVACIKGLQGSDLTDQASIVATAKHFLGDGGTAFGSSTQNILDTPYLLDQGVTDLDDAAINKLFLPPYADAVKHGVRVVMTSFSSTRDGGKVTGDRHWITDVLKGKLGFTGMVVSDWGAVDQIDPSDYEASVTAAIDAGVDMVMVPYDAVRFQAALQAAVARGDVPGSRIDDAVRRILRVKFEMGLFEHPCRRPACGLASVRPPTVPWRARR